MYFTNIKKILRVKVVNKLNYIKPHICSIEEFQIEIEFLNPFS